MIRLTDLLKEESFTAINKDTGKVSVFKSKDSRDAAVKAGTHDKKKDDGEKEPKGGKPNMFSKDAGYDAGDDGLGWGDETDRTPATSLPKSASELTSKHLEIFEKDMKDASGLDFTTDTDDNTGAMVFTASGGDEPTYTIFIGSNEDYGKPEEFRVSLESTYGNDPAGLGGKVDKTFKSAEDAKKFAAQVAKKYSKEMQMDDSEEYDTTPSIDLSTDEDGTMSSKAANAITNLLNKELGVDGSGEVTDNGVITYGLANSEGEWNSALYIGKNGDKFVVSVESDGGQEVGDSLKDFDTEKEAVAYAVELGKKYKDEFAAPEPKEEPKAGLLPSQEKEGSFHWTTGKLQPKKADKKLVSLVNKLSKKAKLDPDKISREEYEKRMLSVVHDALEDANFHGANRQIFADLQGKPELAKRPDYSKAPEMGTPEREEWDMNNSIYNKNFDGITSEFDGSNDFATTLSSESGWDGEQTIAALLAKMRKDGHGNLADRVQASFDKAMENNEAKLKLGDLI